MANVHRAGLVCAAVAGSLIVGVSGPLANAQKPPVPSVAPAAPAALQQQPSPVVPNVAGIAVGSPMSVVDAKCKEAGVTCIRGTRKTKSHTLDRVRIELPASSPFMRAYVTAKAGTVFAIKGTFRADDSTRFQTMEKGLGKSTPSRGVAAWTTPANGVVTQLGFGGRSVRYIDTKAANAKGIAFSPQDFIKKLDRPLSLAPEAAPSAGGFGRSSPRPSLLHPSQTRR